MSARASASPPSHDRTAAHRRSVKAETVQHGINVVAIVFNNSSCGNVLRDQRQVRAAILAAT
jgi:hypothetical protein